MKQRLADYLAEVLVSHGITQNFMLTGGGAMHLNDALGHKKGLHTLYQHHEQALAMAAESYARIYNRPGLVTVTSGPGGTNAITGVLGAWLDSIPMIVLSGQVRYDNTARWSGTGIRAMGDQEFEITKAIACMTKYAEMLIDPYRVRYAIEKCLYLSQTGRPGPCWLDIPLNVQGCYIETEDLIGFDPENYAAGGDGWAESPSPAHHSITPVHPAIKRHPETAAALQGYAAADGQDARREMLARYQEMPNPHVLPEDADPALAGNPPRERLPETDDARLRQYAKEILDKLRSSKRPVFYTGNGIRIAGAENLFLEVAERLGIPVVVGWNAPDIIPTAHALYAGRPGGRGDRPGNLTVQNADLILSIGSRLNIRQVGYNYASWAKNAYVIVNDIDWEELHKPSVHADLRIHADARALLQAIRGECVSQGVRQLFSGGEGISYKDARSISHTREAAAVLDRAAEENTGRRNGTEGDFRLGWLETAQFYRANYPTVLPEYLAESGDPGEKANVYAVVDILSEMAQEGQVTVVGNGSPCVAGGQAYRIKEGTRFISQDGVASMGYDLPAAIGACMAVHGREKGSLEYARRNPYWAGREENYPDYAAHDILLLTGDGSIQMNLQELQTIIHHRMPIKIFYLNNGGYHSIRQTQNSFFGKPLVGIGVDSGVEDVPDLSFPDMEKLAAAYGYPYIKARRNSELREAFRRTLAIHGPAVCEVELSLHQEFLPKSAAKRQPDGSLLSPPLEDMSPFLPEEEMGKLML